MTRIRRIAVLLHERQRDAISWPYRLWAIARVWERRGIRVEPVWGAARRIDADLLIPHIDVSYIHDEYWQAIQDFPGPVVNRRVRDVRKRSFSNLLVHPGDGYDGPVIVKTDLNNGGRSEQKIHRGQAPKSLSELLMDRLERYPAFERRRLTSARTLRRYHVFEHARDVRPEVYANPALVVERFVPERRGGEFLLRHYEFFGDYAQGRTLACTDPFVKARPTRLEWESVLPDEIVESRRRFGLDYGKMDFVVHEGRAHLLDISRTIGMGREIDETLVQRSVGFADGLSFFEREGAGM